jgi:hypothetical protein
MKILSLSNENQIILKWLISELYRVKPNLDQYEINLIEKANLNNSLENDRRKTLLFYKFGRIAIWKEIPKISEWLEVEIEEVDIDRLYILPVYDWYLDTGRSFKLIDTIENLSPDRGYKFENIPRQQILHYEKITNMIRNPPTDLNGVVIITSNIEKGLYTIIDGTHRSSVLAKKGRLVHLRAYIGIAPNLSNCIWSIERVDIKKHLSELNHLVNCGSMW